MFLINAILLLLHNYYKLVDVYYRLKITTVLIIIEYYNVGLLNESN